MTFADVGGYDEAKRQIRAVVENRLKPARFERYGVTQNGILLHGPRGTGKTFLAEAAAGEFGMNFLSIPASSLLQRWIGTKQPSRRWQVSSMIDAGVQSKDLARHMSIFEIDEALELLMDSAVEETSANNGLLSEELQLALSTYIEAFGEKVDRIAQYLKAQEAEAEIAKREAARLQARSKSAEARAKGLKGFLCYFMESRQLRQLKGRLNTLTRAKNSCDSLVLDEAAQIPPAFYRITATFSWDEWKTVLEALPSGALAERLAAESAVSKEIDRCRLSDALQGGTSIQGVELVRGHHIRLS